MRVLVLSWLGAIVACLGYGVSSVLQSVAAKRAATVVGLTGILLIIKQVPYLLGLVADSMAFVGNVLALQRLPLFLVQSIVAGSVGVTAVIASLRGARLSWKDWTSLAVLGAGLVLLSVTAVPTAAARIPLFEDWVILVTAIAPAAIGLIGFKMKGRASTIVLSSAAGLGFTGWLWLLGASARTRFHGPCCSIHCSGRSSCTVSLALPFLQWPCSETRSRS
jgi:drug/metabolite transporter (DMT)-like permease